MTKKISFVIPCYYSEKTLEGVVNDIYVAFPPEQYNFEVILVNDGSTDGTFQVIKMLADKYDNIVGVNLAKNFGQDGARMAGYAVSKGDYIISLDDDGQNPPMEAHKLIEELEKGYDAVFGKYHVKKHSKFKNFGSKVNDIMATMMIGKPKDLGLCSYFIMNRFVCDEILKYKGAYPYIWGLILRCTSNLSNVYIEHRVREVGETTYTFKKLLGLWLNGFTSFSVKPLRVASIAGVFTALVGFIYAIVIIIQKICYGTAVDGWASTISVILLLGGIQLIVVGLMGEYIGRMYISINNAPQYVIRELVEKDKTQD